LVAPWALKKTDPARMQEVLAVLCEVIRQVAVLIQPVMPESAAKMLDQLGVGPEQRLFDSIGGKARLGHGHEIDKPVPVFPRYVEEEDA